MADTRPTIPDHTAVRTALWRALHTQVDAYPYVLDDTVGLKLIGSDDSWRQRPDMAPGWTRGYRASIVGRARYIEDLVEEQAERGVTQYIIMGAGLDTFVQRRPDLAAKIQVFEIDKPETQEWKRQRLMNTGYGISNNLHLVPVDFEAGESWREKLVRHGFKENQPAVIVSTGVAMYLTREANLKTFREIATLAPGSTFAMTFMLPLDLLDPLEREDMVKVSARAAAAGTPFISFFRPAEILELAQEAGFRKAKVVSRDDLVKRYFAGRTDGLIPATGEEFLVATT